MDGTKKCKALRGLSLWIVVGITIFVALFSGSACAEVPISDGFDYPIGIPNGKGWTVAQDFQDTYNYINGLRGQHLGEDWNYGSGSDDVGQPVCSIGNGEVLSVSYIPDKYPSDPNKGGWGRVILIKHTLPKGSKYEYVVSLYGHLGIDPKQKNYREIHKGDPVTRNQIIGYVGTKSENGGWSPHLHFEIRTPEFKKRFGSDLELSGGYDKNALGWINPTSITSSGNPTKNEGFVDINRPSTFPVAKSAQILTQSISPTIISPNSKLTFVFSIKNPNSDSIKNVRLGAQVRTHSPVGPWIDSSANDKIVTLSPGTKDYSRTFTFINPELVSSGYYDARWVILDDKTGTWIDSETMTRIFEVKTQSQPPVLTPIGDKSVSEKEKLTFRISAKDPDGDKVTYSAEGLPSGAKLTSSGLFTWTPGSGTAGKYTVKFIATANGQIDYETITITVNNPSSALPEITSITPSKTEAGTFDLTIKGKNFNSKTAVEMVYFDGKYVGQGTIKSRSSTKIVVTEKMTGALPGVYVVKVRNNPSDPATESNGKELTITAVPVTLSISPASGKQGTTFSFTGKGYTPNGKIEWHVKKPDGTEFPVGILTASSSGNLKYTYKSNSGSMIGTYNIWAVDQSTGRVSNQVKERIR